MSELDNIHVGSLKLDLSNYRTVCQKSENDSINAMIAISPDWFWALMENILEDGYYSTDNIIVLRVKDEFIVKEGNRRAASLKIIYGYIKEIEVPEHIKNKIDMLDDEWKDKNINIPCAIYEEDEAETVKKLISLIHAKGEKAGREQWTAVAKARYNRDEKNIKEAGLDLLEKYLSQGKNLTTNEKECWGGDYPISILYEALSKLYPYLNYPSIDELLENYPAKNRAIIENILYDIGAKKLTFKKIRAKIFWGLDYGLVEKTPAVQEVCNNIVPVGDTDNEQQLGDAEHNTDDASNENPTVQKKHDDSNSIESTSNKQPDSSDAAENKANKTSKSKQVAYSLQDPKSVKKRLKNLKPSGQNREKVVSLLKELQTLNIETHPLSFCFLLRSMFEISAKAFCQDHKQDGLHATKKDGADKMLSDMLRDIVNFITSNMKILSKTKELHGALTELNKKDGILSVTSLNQLVHNPTFSILATDICKLFHNVFPLLEEMNR